MDGHLAGKRKGITVNAMIPSVMYEILLYFDRVIQFIVHQDTTAVLTHDDLLTLAYLTLSLWGDSVEATAAGIT